MTDRMTEWRTERWTTQIQYNPTFLNRGYKNSKDMYWYLSDAGYIFLYIPHIMNNLFDISYKSSHNVACSSLHKNLFYGEIHTINSSVAYHD